MSVAEGFVAAIVNTLAMSESFQTPNAAFRC